MLPADTCAGFLGHFVFRVAINRYTLPIRRPRGTTYMSIDPAPAQQSFTTPGNCSQPGAVPGADLPDALVDLNRAGSAGTPGLTVVVPTRDEKDTIQLLLARLGPAFAALNAELVIVDDSDDGTPDRLGEAGGEGPGPGPLPPP